MGEITFYFETLFPDYDTFATFLTDYNVCNVADPTTNATAKYFYGLLIRAFSGNNVAYDTPTAFCSMFASVLEDHFEQFRKQRDMIQTVQALTDDELLDLGNRLQNMAENPNTAPADPTAPLEFVSSQLYEQTKNGKLRGYLDAIRNMPSMRIGPFLDKFRFLFVPYWDSDETIYRQED